MRKKRRFLIILCSFLIWSSVVLTGGFLVGFNQGKWVYETGVLKLPVSENFTGSTVWSEINTTREENSLPPFTLNSGLCNGISDRLEEVKKNRSHEGIEEYMAEKWRRGIWGKDLVYVAEFFAGDVSTPGEAVGLWLTSPPHSQSLLDGTLTQGCAFTDNTGWVVLLLGRGS